VQTAALKYSAALNAQSHITAARGRILDAPYPALCAPQGPSRPTHRRSEDTPAVQRLPYPAAMAIALVLLGGLIALVGSVTVQAFVIPRVNRRTRAIDRWEQDVLLLGTLISDHLSVASAKAFHAWTSWRVLRDRPADTFLSGEQAREMETEDRKRAESFREAWRDYERLANVRSDWLAKRIASRDLRHVPYLAVEHSVAVLGKLPAALVTDDWTAYDVDEIDQWWRSEAEERTRLQERVTELAESIAAPSPSGPIGRLRQWTRSSRIAGGR
jgi:hypothetical protein